MVNIFEFNISILFTKICLLALSACLAVYALQPVTQRQHFSVSTTMPFNPSLIFSIGPKSDHCLVLSVIETALFELCSKFVKIVKWIFIGPRSDHSLLMSVTD